VRPRPRRHRDPVSQIERGDRAKRFRRHHRLTPIRFFNSWAVSDFSRRITSHWGSFFSNCVVDSFQYFARPKWAGRSMRASSNLRLRFGIREECGLLYRRAPPNTWCCHAPQDRGDRQFFAGPPRRSIRRTISATTIFWSVFCKQVTGTGRNTRQLTARIGDYIVRTARKRVLPSATRS
jgi:hypothetical protein